MKITWNDYEEFPDGSKSGHCDAVVEIGGTVYDGIWIVDHTTPQQMEEDRFVGRTVRYAYDVYMGPFMDFHVDPNSTLNTGRLWEGGTPEHTIDDVKRMVEDQIIKRFTFDYEERKAEVLAHLEKQRLDMEEVLAFKKQRDESEVTS